MKKGPYSEKLIKHFQDPHNQGEIEDPDGEGEAGNIVCGDVMKITLNIKEKEDKRIIEDIKFQTYGCLAAIASSSILTDLVKGKTIKETLELKRDKIVESLGGLPPVKKHCSVLALEALYEALYEHLKEKGEEIPEKLKGKHEKVEKEMEEISERHEEMEE